MSAREPTWPAATLAGRLPPGPRNALLNAGTEVRFQAREMLLQQDDPGDHALLLRAGFIKIISDVESGESPLLAIRGRGDLVGEMATLDDRPRSATAVAATSVAARRIGKDSLTELIREYPEVGSAIRFIAHERLRWANRRRIDFVSQRPKVRVARVLVEIAETYGERSPDGVRLDIALTQLDIAWLAGTKKRATETALSELKRDGLVRLRYRQVIVTDLTGLRTVA